MSKCHNWIPSRAQSSSSDNTDYHSIESDGNYPTSDDDFYPPESSKGRGQAACLASHSSAPNVTLSRGHSSRMRFPDERQPRTPSKPFMEEASSEPSSASTVRKASTTSGTRTEFRNDQRNDGSQPLSASGPSSPISSNFLSGITHLFDSPRSPPSKPKSMPRVPPRIMPDRVIDMSDSDADSGTDTDSDAQDSPLAAKNIFSSQSTIPSNTTSMTSLNSPPRLSPGKWTSSTDSPCEDPFSHPTEATSISAGLRASRKRDSPLPIRKVQVPKTPSGSRVPRRSPPSTQEDIFVRLSPVVSARSTIAASPSPSSPTHPPPVHGPPLQSPVPPAPRSYPTRSAAMSSPAHGLITPSDSRATQYTPPSMKQDVFTQPAPSIGNGLRPSAFPAPAREPGPRIHIPQTQPPAPPSHPVSSAAVDAFLQRDLCRDLEHHIIAHDKEAQAKFDTLAIEWGVQFQLARGQTNGLWTWEKVCQRMDRLVGSNEEIGPQIVSIMLEEKVGNSSTDSKIWAEFDREQAAIMENKGRGLGLMGEWMGVPDWHGGRIQQLARLTKKDDGTLTLTLEPLEKRRSHRFARFLGSRRVLQIRVPEKLAQEFQDEVRKFFARRFILLGRSFVPFHVKDGSVYMVEISLDHERVPQEWCGDQFRLTFTEFMEWHNPMSLNSKQAISKFVTRYAISLSNTIPAIEFARENIIFIDDINSSDWPVGNSKAPTEKIMTDGCGFINCAALAIITRKLGYESAPTALQGRIDGSKGLWVRHPTDDSDEPKIWIRGSQNKIKNPRLDRAHRIFELVGPSKASTSVSLSAQSILNLNHNDVPSEIIVELFRQGLKDEVSPLLRWDSMPLLYDAVNKAGGVTGARLARIADGNGRALGVQKAQWRPDDVEESPSDQTQESDSATYTGRNPYSGAPHSIYEYLLETIQAGFCPQESHNQQGKLKQVIKNVVDSAVEKCRIPMDGSIAAWLIPDPLAMNPTDSDWNPVTMKRDDLGLLKEGQIYFKSSQPLKDDNEMAYHVITGEVVVGRYPMRLPSDLQKVTAVDIPEYALYTDVVIVSVNGTSSLPSLLSGGDMDGDIVNIFRDPGIVEHFTNKPLTEPPADLMEANFEKDIVSVESFCSRALDMTSNKAQQWYLEFILKDVVTPQKGLYSMFHDNAVSRYGYDHSDTIRLAYVFNALLDASKTGLRLKEGIFEQDQKNYGSKPDPFGILKALKDEGQKILVQFLQTFDQIAAAASGGKDVSRFKDKDLLQPYEDALALAHSFQETGLRNGENDCERDERILVGKFIHNELRAIVRHVDAAKEEFMARFGRKMIREQQESQFGSQASPSKARAKKGAPTSKSDQADDMYKAAKMFSAPVEGIRVFKSNIEELKASCAVYSQHSAAEFPWVVGFKGLCTIKAKARGIAPAVREIDECKSMSSSVAKVLAKTSGTVTF